LSSYGTIVGLVICRTYGTIVGLVTLVDMLLVDPCSLLFVKNR
jgi:hypothetical protein